MVIYMKYVVLLLSVIILLFSFGACVKTPADIPQSTTENSQMNDDIINFDDVVESSTKVTETTESTTEKVTQKNEMTSADSSATETTTLSVIESLQASEVETYYSENPKNKYICSVADKYGVDKMCLVALIRTKAQNPGATVLQFSGKIDENGELLKTESELKYVYEIDDTTGEIYKASGKAHDNDGYSFVESFAVFKITKEYILPQLEEAKENRTYPE